VIDPRVVVVGGGLAGIAASLACVDAGARVTLIERRNQLGGLTRSFRHGDWELDNGQHVFLRCCDAYLGLLERLGARDEVTLQDRLSIPVLRPGGPTGWLRRRAGWPAPLHLGPSLARYPHIGLADRLRLGRAALPLARLDLHDPALDTETFGAWLARHGQRPRSVEALWDLITLPTVNLRAAEASLAMAAKVFQTGLLTDAPAADIGWSRVPLGHLHGRRAAQALGAARAAVLTDERVLHVDDDHGGAFRVQTERRVLHADAVVVAVPHDAVATVLPEGVVEHQDRLAGLGHSAVVNVHLFYDRPVMRHDFAAAVDSPVEYVFDRSASAGVTSGQYLAVSLSGADALLGDRPDAVIDRIAAGVAELFPAARSARVLDRLVTRERTATFRAVPGSGALRAGTTTARRGLVLAGAWTDTGWPATMEGAVRSGRAAAREALIATGRSRKLPEEVA